MFRIIRILLVSLIFVGQTSCLFADRIKDLTSLAGIRSNQLVGYGVVVGLAGTGDGNTGITLQSMQSISNSSMCAVSKTSRGSWPTRRPQVVSSGG